MTEIRMDEELRPEEQKFVQEVATFVVSVRKRAREITVREPCTAEEREYLEALNAFVIPRIREIREFVEETLKKRIPKVRTAAATHQRHSVESQSEYEPCEPHVEIEFSIEAPGMPDCPKTCLRGGVIVCDP